MARYLRFTALEEIEGRAQVRASRIGVIPGGSSHNGAGL